MNPHHALLTACYEKFNGRDIDGVLTMFHPDVDWPNGMDGGRVRGHQGVERYWTRQWTILDPTVSPLSFCDDDSGRTVVEVRQVVRDLTGHVLIDQIVHHVYTIRHGFIERMDIQPST